jgi:hypothetical protein
MPSAWRAGCAGAAGEMRALRERREEDEEIRLAALGRAYEYLDR